MRGVCTRRREIGRLLVNQSTVHVVVAEDVSNFEDVGRSALACNLTAPCSIKKVRCRPPSLQQRG